MSWNASTTINKANAKMELASWEPAYPLGKGAAKQFAKTKEAVGNLLEVTEGKSFNVSLSGHCQQDSPGSAADSINIFINAAA